MLRFVFFGSLFGFILSRVGATDFDRIANMFLLRDFHLVGVIGVGIAVAAAGLALVRRLGLRDKQGRPLSMARKPRHGGNLAGGLIFGAGWGLTGTCPGTALSQLGEGRMTSVFTIAGMMVGVSLYLKYGARLRAALTRSAPTPEAAPASK